MIYQSKYKGQNFEKKCGQKGAISKKCTFKFILMCAVLSFMNYYSSAH